MKIVLAPDSFKHSMSALQVVEAMSRGIVKVFPHARIVKLPVADGGEGTVKVLVSSTQGRLIRMTVIGPLGEPVEATYGILGDQKTAVIEMASASGLPLVPQNRRNPLDTTTYGTGQLMADAMKRGCRRLIVGIGGSATTDCGTGMAQALGVKFYQKQHKELREYMTGGLMGLVRHLDLSNLNPKIVETEIIAACDVDNPLLGPTGAVMTYSKQKGASDVQLDILERNMQAIIKLIEAAVDKSIQAIPGAGAAGGLGAGLMAFTHAKLQSGARLVLDACQFDEKIQGAQLILTGEGKIDEQTEFGKTISALIEKAAKHRIPVIAVTGTRGAQTDSLHDQGLTAAFSICPGPVSVEAAIRNGEQYVEETVIQIMRTLQVRI
ncbi:glycerate kinase [candidate division KSB1 bacterium]|nr:glycerate kinase [candidate division KSB1 bacterium]